MVVWVVFAPVASTIRFVDIIVHTQRTHESCHITGTNQLIRPTWKDQKMDDDKEDQKIETTALHDDG